MSTKARRPLTLREMQKMSKADLRDICRERGLILGGRKAELISRIESYVYLSFFILYGGRSSMPENRNFFSSMDARYVAMCCGRR